METVCQRVWRHQHTIGQRNGGEGWRFEALGCSDGGCKRCIFFKVKEKRVSVKLLAGRVAQTRLNWIRATCVGGLHSCVSSRAQQMDGCGGGCRGGSLLFWHLSSANPMVAALGGQVCVCVGVGGD